MRAERVVAITCNACDVDLITRIRDLVEGHGFYLDTMYVSNIHEYVKGAPAYAFQRMLARMVTARTMLIAATRDAENRLTQRITYGPFTL